VTGGDLLLKRAQNSGGLHLPRCDSAASLSRRRLAPRRAGKYPHGLHS
jgi:hypothetical protein